MDERYEASNDKPIQLDLARALSTISKYHRGHADDLGIVRYGVNDKVDYDMMSVTEKSATADGPDKVYVLKEATPDEIKQLAAILLQAEADS